MFNFRNFVVLTISLLGATTGNAQAPELLKDVNLVQQSQNILLGTQAGATFFFSRTTKETGWELWASDGTEVGTRLVKDITPGPGSSAPYNYVAAQKAGVDFVYFTAQTEAEGRELWVSDGTEAGTKLVKDIYPGQVSSDPRWISVPAGNDTALFSADSPTTGREVWYSNGTTAGTSILVDARPGSAGSDPTHILFLGTAALWSANDGTNGREPWGFLGGAGMVSNVRPGSGSSDANAVVFDGTNFLFLASDGTHGTELWRSNFTTTTLVKDITVGSGSSKITGLTTITPSTSIFFNQAGIGFQLWRTDGTDAGTALVYDFGTQFPFPSFLNSLGSFSTSGTSGVTGLISPIAVSDGKAYFFVTNPSDTFLDLSLLAGELWVTDGTPAGTMMVSDIFPGLGGTLGAQVFSVGSSVIAPVNNGTNGTELWRSSGTAATSSLIADMNPGVAGFFESIPQLFFGGIGGFVRGTTGIIAQGTIGFEQKLIFSDGTSANTRVLGDVGIPDTTKTSYAHFVGSLGSKAFFAADDGTIGNELYTTDGTPNGTQLLKDITPLGSTFLGTFQEVPNSGKLVFSASDFTNGAELWVSDGTTVGTTLLKDISPGSGSSRPSLSEAALNGEVYLSATDPIHGTEIWATNGTPDGTRLVKDINPGIANGVTEGFTRYGDRIFFGGSDLSHGAELWVTDGTTAGTQLFLDIVPGATDSGPTLFVAAGDTLYFVATDTSHGTELWKTDGTPGGTMMVRDINPGGTGSSPFALTPVGSKVYFTATDATHGSELWVTDGTVAGTTLVKDIAPGAASSTIYSLTAFGNRVIFSATDGTHGQEPWVSEGTASTTMMLADLNTDPFGSSYPEGFLAFPETNYLVFGGYSSTYGNELWRTDGTPEGTVLMIDFTPGAGSSSPQSLRAVNGNLFLTLDKDSLGREPWRITIDQCPGDLNKLEVGVCGCGAVDIDTNGTGTFDCLAGVSLKERVLALQLALKSVRPVKTKRRFKKVKAAAAEAKGLLADLIGFGKLNATKISISGGASLDSLLNKVQKRTLKTLRLRKKTLKADAKISTRMVARLLRALN